MRLLLTCSLTFLVAGSLAADRPAVNSPVAEEPTRQMLGAYELPYSGSGSIIYDSDEAIWVIAFQAPEGWLCTEVGYAFATPDREFTFDVDGERTINMRGRLDVHGELVVRQEGNSLFATVRTDEAQYRFELLTHGELPADTLEATTGEGAGSAVAAEENCPGGSCECDGKCRACCSEGFHPNCNCSGAGACRCVKNKIEKIQLELISAEIDGSSFP